MSDVAWCSEHGQAAHLRCPACADAVEVNGLADTVRSLRAERDALKTSLSSAVEALKDIASVKYGLDMADDDETARKYWSKLAIEYQTIAREALGKIGHWT